METRLLSMNSRMALPSRSSIVKATAFPAAKLVLSRESRTKTERSCPDSNVHSVEETVTSETSQPVSASKNPALTADLARTSIFQRPPFAMDGKSFRSSVCTSKVCVTTGFHAYTGVFGTAATLVAGFAARLTDGLTASITKKAIRIAQTVSNTLMANCCIAGEFYTQKATV